MEKTPETGAKPCLAGHSTVGCETQRHDILWLALPIPAMPATRS